MAKQIKKEVDTELEVVVGSTLEGVEDTVTENKEVKDKVIEKPEGGVPEVDITQGAKPDAVEELDEIVQNDLVLEELKSIEQEAAEAAKLDKERAEQEALLREASAEDKLTERAELFSEKTTADWIKQRQKGGYSEKVPLALAIRRRLSGMR